MAKKQKKIEITAVDVLRERGATGENQLTYWSRVGIGQSGGSRYESGRRIPKSVRMLIALATGKATIEQLQSGYLAENIN